MAGPDVAAPDSAALAAEGQARASIIRSETNARTESSAGLYAKALFKEVGGVETFVRHAKEGLPNNTKVVADYREAVLHETDDLVEGRRNMEQLAAHKSALKT